tara:strand:- start:386 stop:742 length:357 start_codon:yes stop_codon:yes gene_type:complete
MTKIMTKKEFSQKESTFKSIPSFPRYEINILGTMIRDIITKKIRNFDQTGRFIKKAPFHQTMIKSTFDKYTSARVHILVAETFIGPRINNARVTHIDGNNFNNEATNLKYAELKSKTN